MADDALTRKEAEMGKLTFEKWWAMDDQSAPNPKEYAWQAWQAAISSRALSLESVREEALVFKALLQEVTEVEDLNDFRRLRDRIRLTLQHAPARVAEGGVRDATLLMRSETAAKLAGQIEDKMRVSQTANGDIQVRLYSQYELQTVLAALRTLAKPESPAKEQPGEQWIPVSERLPELDDFYWCMTKCPPQSHPQQAIRFRDGEWYTSWPVTHWMPLPPPPERP